MGLRRRGELPLRVWLGVALTLDRFWLSAEVDLQHPLDNPTVGVERDFVWNARVGAHYEVDESVRVGAGLFTDNRTRTRIRYLGEENMDYYGGTLGLELRTPHRLGEGEDADSLIFSSTFALRYAVGVGEVVGLSLDPTVGELASPDPLLASTVHEISLHIGSALFF